MAPWLVIAGMLLLAAGVAPLLIAQDDTNEAVDWAIRAPLAPRSLLLDVAVAGDRLVAVGERGHILLSDDKGASWRQVEVPTRAVLTGVFFHDPQLGWAVGHDAVILRTRDAGETWQRVHFAPEEESPFLDVWFDSADHGYAIGAYGFFYVTDDGGDSWEWRAISEYDFHLHHIARSAAGRLYMAAEAGMVYRSDDGGESWIELPSPYEGSFFATLPVADDGVLLFGLRGHLFRSEDGGETWQELDTGTVAMLTDGITLLDGRLLLVGLGGTVLVSDNGGRSFTLHAQPNRLGISAVLQIPDGALIVVGEGGVRRLSVDEMMTAGGGEKGGETS